MRHKSSYRKANKIVKYIVAFCTVCSVYTICVFCRKFYEASTLHSYCGANPLYICQKTADRRMACIVRAKTFCDICIPYTFTLRYTNKFLYHTLNLLMFVDP